MFTFHTFADFTIGQGARRKGGTIVGIVVRFGYERLIVNVDGSEYEWYPAECVPVTIETQTQTTEGSTMITIDTIGSIHTVYAHVPDRRSKAKPGATRIISARRNGATKTWKTRPAAFRAPFKYGLKECFYVTDANAHQFFTTEEEAAQSPVQTCIG